MLILLTKFAEARNEKADTIRKYIRRHEEQFEGHIDTTGKQMLLDEVAVKLLEEIYPLPQVVQVIEDTESREKLIKAQEVIIQLQQRINEQTQLIAQAEAVKMLLEDKQVQLEQANARLDRMEAENLQLRNALADEQAKTWWNKLIGK